MQILFYDIMAKTDILVYKIKAMGSGEQMNYVLLFRGINVGGKNVIKMNTLRQFLLDLGLNNVKTYVQSGNAVAESDLDENSLKEKILIAFLKNFGFESSVIVRNIHEMNCLIEHLPITSDEITLAEASDPQVEHLYVYFLDNPPEQLQLDLALKEYIGSDILRAGEKEVYLLCHQSIRKSKLAARLSKIFATATVRNWNSVCNLYDMLNTM
jgi:uncharacterized protein (DUF1697 family)